MNYKYAIEYERDGKRTVANVDKLLIDNEPFVEGVWIKEETEYGWDGRSYQCSACGRSIHIDTVMEDVKLDYPYCHCGARMRVEE